MTFEKIYREITGQSYKASGKGRVHLSLDAYGFDVGAQPIALDARMFLDQAFFIKQSILHVMRARPKTPYTIVGHSVGCLIAMLIEDELRKELPNAPIVNIVCLATPLADSPTIGLNRDIERVMTKIRDKQQDYKERSDDHTLFMFFNGGLKDNMITESFSNYDQEVLSDISRSYHERIDFHRNAVYINTETDMRGVYGSMHHSSFFYQKQFMEAFVVGLGKMIIAGLEP